MNGNDRSSRILHLNYKNPVYSKAHKLEYWVWSHQRRVFHSCKITEGEFYRISDKQHAVFWSIAIDTILRKPNDSWARIFICMISHILNYQIWWSYLNHMHWNLDFWVMGIKTAHRSLERYDWVLTTISEHWTPSINRLILLSDISYQINTALRGSN